MSKRRLRLFSTEFKERAVLRMLAGERVAALSGELGVPPQMLYDWAKGYRRDGVAGLNRKRGPKPGGVRVAARSERKSKSDPLSQAQAQARIAELERLVGQQQVDLDFFQQALRLFDADSPSGTAPTSTRSSKP